MEEKINHIFLVDDDFSTLKIGKAALQNKYIVTAITSGEKLLHLLKRAKPDLILLDVLMPDLCGYDTIKILKANPETAEIPVIFLTGKNEDEDELLGLSLGAVDYITKPFSQPLLLKRIELHLQLQAQKNELRLFNENLHEMVREQTNEVNALQNAIIMWAAEIIEFRNEETGWHVGRVQEYLRLLLNEMRKTDLYSAEISTWDIDAFIKSAILHDVGKIKISDEILLKKSRLTIEELEDMKLHSLYGKLLIERLQTMLPNQIFLEYAKTLAYAHHEKWDGTGYPDRLKGEEIPLNARMMSLVDVYDALISERPYKRAFSHEEAMQIISDGRGTQFDPYLTDLFLGLSDKLKSVSDALSYSLCA